MFIIGDSTATCFPQKFYSKKSTYASDIVNTLYRAKSLPLFITSIFTKAPLYWMHKYTSYKDINEKSFQ